MPKSLTAQTVCPLLKAISPAPSREEARIHFTLPLAHASSSSKSAMHCSCSAHAFEISLLDRARCPWLHNTRAQPALFSVSLLRSSASSRFARAVASSPNALCSYARITSDSIIRGGLPSLLKWARLSSEYV